MQGLRSRVPVTTGDSCKPTADRLQGLSSAPLFAQCFGGSASPFVDFGLGLVERQVEQLEPAEQVALDAVASEDPPDGLLGLVERLYADVAGHQRGVLRVDHRRRPPML